MHYLTIEAFANAHIQHLAEVQGHGLSTTEAVLEVARDTANFVGARHKWVGGEDGGYYEAYWDRGMFIDYEHHGEPGKDFARWIEFTEGVDPYGGVDDFPDNYDEDPFEKYYDGSSMEVQR